MTRRMYLNLPVKDLEKSKEFFSKLGFSFNPQFTGEKAACLVIGENIFAMLLTEEFFKSFTKKALADATKTTEVLIGIDEQNREKVDTLVNKAVAAGGLEYREPTDDAEY